MNMGRVHEESMPQAHTIKVGKELRVKIRRLYRDGLLGVISIINPLHYREYPNTQGQHYQLRLSPWSKKLA